MSNDPLELPENWADPPDGTDFDAAYAAVMATERGRWFLTQCASRNPRPETTALVAATHDAAPAPSLASVRRDLIALTAAINRVEAKIAAGAAQTPNDLAAAERIQDIAFALRERGVDTALCDALDSAIREINNVCAQHAAAAERTREVADLLHDLAGRGNDMPALPIAADSAGRSAAAAVVERIEAEPETAIEDNARSREAIDQDRPPPGLPFFQLELVQGNNYALAVAALAASFSTFAEPSEPKSNLQGEPSDAIKTPMDSEAEPPSAEPVSALFGGGEASVAVTSKPSGSDTASASLEPQPIEALPVEAASIESFTSAPTESAGDQAAASEDELQLNKIVPASEELGTISPKASTDDLSHTEPEGHVGGDAATIGSPAASPGGESAGEAGPPVLPGRAEPSASVETVATPPGDESDEASCLGLGTERPLPPESQPPAGPEDDPGDLFGPLPLPSPLWVSVVEEGASAGAPETPGDVAPTPEGNQQTTVATVPGVEQAELVEPAAPILSPANEQVGKGDVAPEPPLASDSGSEDTSQAPSTGTAASADSPTAAAAVKPETPVSFSLPRAAAAPVTAPARPISRSAPIDPLSAVRALSDEEIIALFS